MLLPKRTRKTSAGNAKKRCLETLKMERSENRADSSKKVADFCRSTKPTTH